MFDSLTSFTSITLLKCALLGLQIAGANSLFNLKFTQYAIDERPDWNNQKPVNKDNEKARQPVQYAANQLYTDSTDTAGVTENLERYGMSDEDFDWMKKAVQEYRREIARRAGHNVSYFSIKPTVIQK